MSYKTILVHVGADAEAAVRLEAAMTLGARFSSTILGVGSAAWDPCSDPMLGYVDGETIQALRDDVDADLAASESRFRALCAGYPHPVIWRPVMDYPDHAMASLSRCADLIVASRPPRGERSDRFPWSEDLVMETGLPVLVIPANYKSRRPRKVMVGWKNTREARRAVSDALPLLEAAEHVFVVQVAEDREANDDSSLRDLVDRLDRHGIEADVAVAPLLKRSAAEELMAIADGRDADVLVLGAYGHSRPREWVFGGVTADLIGGASRPVLFSR